MIDAAPIIAFPAIPFWIKVILTVGTLSVFWLLWTPMRTLEALLALVLYICPGPTSGSEVTNFFHGTNGPIAKIDENE
jgi:hypothetical protein